MRLNELVRTLLPEGGTVVDRTGSAHAWPPLIKVADDVPAQPADDMLTTVTVEGTATADDVRATFDGIVTGERVLLLLPWPAHQVPVGSVIQGLVSAGMQAVEAHPLADTAWNVAVVCRRVDEQVEELHAYLDRRRSPGPLTGSTLLRLVDEHVVEGVVWRSQERQARDTRRALDAALAARDELAAGRDVLRQERDAACSERDAANAERDAATAEAEAARDVIRSERERLVRQLDEVTGRAEHLENRVRGIVQSRTYRVARRAARAARWVGRRQG